MSKADELIVRLPQHLRQAVFDKVERGEFANENEVIISSVQAFVDEDAEVEEWLRNEVAPTYDRIVAGEPTLSAEEVLNRLEARMQRGRNRDTDV